MSDLSDAEVNRYLAELERLPVVEESESAVRRAWYWLGEKSRNWSPAKSALTMTGAMVVLVTALVLLREWKLAFILTVVYIPLTGILMLFALLESERPNGRAGQIGWSNDQAGWGPPR